MMNQNNDEFNYLKNFCDKVEETDVKNAYRNLSENKSCFVGGLGEVKKNFEYQVETDDRRKRVMDILNTSGVQGLLNTDDWTPPTVDRHGEGCKCSYCEPANPLLKVESFVTINGKKVPYSSYSTESDLKDLNGSPDVPGWVVSSEGKQWVGKCGQKAAENTIDKSVEKMTKEPANAVVISKLLVYYVNVGQMAPVIAEALVERIKDQNENVFSRLPKNCEVLYIATCEGPTRIETLELT